MLLWENLSAGRHLAKIENGLSKSAVLTHVSRLLEEGSRSGKFRSGLDPRLVLTSLIGLCLVYFSNRFTLSQSVGVDFTTPKNLQRTADHAAAFFLAGLSKSFQAWD
jgi:TetR/AcrR family transcriptional regulator